MRSLTHLTILGLDYKIKDSELTIKVDSKLDSPAGAVSAGQVPTMTATGLIWKDPIDPTISAWARASVKPSYSYSEILNTPQLSIVATSGDFADLENIPDYALRSDLNNYQLKGSYVTTDVFNETISNYALESDLAVVASSGEYSDLLNKPTKLSQFTNDKNYITANDASISNIAAALAAKADLIDNKVPVEQIPDINNMLIGYYDSEVGQFYKDADHTETLAGSKDKIYVDITPEVADVYAWNSTDGFVLITSDIQGLKDSIQFKADLVDGKIPAEQLPSFVNDVLEGYYFDGVFYEDIEHTITYTGASGVLYVDLTNSVNFEYTVTGATTDNVNGDYYKLNRTSNERPIYTNGYYFIRWYNGMWEITEEDENSNSISPICVVVSDDLDLPLTGWQQGENIITIVPYVDNKPTTSEVYRWSGSKYIKITAGTDLSVLATVASTGDYSDLINTPVIPSKTSQLTNDSNFVPSDKINKSYVEDTTLVLADYIDTDTEGTDKSYLDLPVTAFEVLANDSIIVAGTIDPVTGLKYTNEVPAGMTEKFQIRSYTSIENIDVVIDWGDNTVAPLSEGCEEYVEGSTINEYLVSHTYKTPGRYIIKVYGSKYYNIWHYWLTDGVKDEDEITRHSLICRAFTEDLPVASHITNFSNFFGYSLRHLSLKAGAQSTAFRPGCNLSGFCRNNYNLLSATGLSNINDIYSASYLFINCKAMTTTDFVLPKVIRNTKGLQGVFQECQSLTSDISKLVGKSHFSSTVLDIYALFFRCAKLTGTVPSSYFWLDKRMTWSDARHVFTGCSDVVRSQAPVGWGGTSEVVDTTEELEDKVTELEKRLKSLEEILTASSSDV